MSENNNKFMERVMSVNDAEPLDKNPVNTAVIGPVVSDFNGKLNSFESKYYCKNVCKALKSVDIELPVGDVHNVSTKAERIHNTAVYLVGTNKGNVVYQTNYDGSTVATDGVSAVCLSMADDKNIRSGFAFVVNEKGRLKLSEEVALVGSEMQTQNDLTYLSEAETYVNKTLQADSELEF